MKNLTMIGKNYIDLKEYKEKLDRDYGEKLDFLVDSFIETLEISPAHKTYIRDYLLEMRKYSYQTYEHSVDTAIRSYLLGSKYLNKNDNYYTLTNEQLTELVVAAIVHDAGKLDIPLEILEAQRKLTDGEFRVMQTHSRNSVNHIQRFPVSIIHLAAHHHEKLDGSGYPDHLKGDEVTLSNRILTVADITSALFQKRSYKNKFNVNNVIKILNEDMHNKKIDRTVTHDMISIIKSGPRHLFIDNEKDKNMQ